MTQALPDILTALSKLIPDRVRAEMGTGGTEPWVYRYEAKYRGWKTVYWGGDWPQESDLSALEYALREECAARGWRWQVTSDSDNGLFGSEIAAQLEPQGRASYFYAGGPTPAQSLATCLLSALNAAQAAAVAADRQVHPESKFDEVGLA